MKTLYLESIAGISGDMFTASFLNAGLVSQSDLQALTAQLKMPNVEIVVSRVFRSGLQATHIDVCGNEKLLEGHHVPYHLLKQIMMSSHLLEAVRVLAIRILDILAQAEAICHGVDKNDVVFHELGMVDSLVDIVMAAFCITTVNPDFVIASPLKLGRGMINTAHGMLPVPPPVSALLATGMPIATIPSAILQDNIELSTPTGIAILKALQPSFVHGWPEGKIVSQGCGAGTMDLDGYPNFFRTCLLETLADVNSEQRLPYLQDTVIEINANYDDSSPERLAWTTEKLFEYGALDVWQTSAVGKKGRVMITLSVLTHSENWAKCVNFILKYTSTFGLRYKPLDRLILAHHFETRDTDEGSLIVKFGCDRHGTKLKEKYEFEDIRRIWDKEL